MTGRSIPVKWYAEQSWDDWLRQLRFGTGIEQRYQAFLALTQLGPRTRVAPISLELLNDSEPEMQAAALRWWQTLYVRDRGEDVAQEAKSMQTHAEKLLRADDPDVRLESAASLIIYDSGHAGAAETFIELMQRADAEPLTRVQMAKTASLLLDHSEVVVPLLGKWLADEHPEVREAAAKSLSVMGNLPASQLPVLLAALEDEEPFVRELVAVTIGNIGIISPEIRERLLVTANDEDPEVARIAQVVLNQLTKSE